MAYAVDMEETMAEENKPVKVLQVALGDGSYGGVASFLYTFYSHMDHRRILCDFLYCAKNSMESKMDTEALTQSKVTALNAIKPTNNWFGDYTKLLSALKKYFKENRYDIVHINTSNVYLCASVLHSVPRGTICITHSHNTKPVIGDSKSLKRRIKNFLFLLCRKYVLRQSDYYFACSKAAGTHLYGMDILDNRKFKVIYNAIDVKRFKFDKNTREKNRNTNNLVFGHVGRMTEQKNPIFLLKIFREIHQQMPNSELWMIGEGELRQNIEKAIKDFNLTDSVKLLGRRNDVAELMQAMDIFIFPSLYEGLSIVTIEAQAAGLPIFASDSISPEHKVTELMSFLSLKQSPTEWADRILSTLGEINVRCDMSSELIAAGYEINNAAKDLENFYINAVN